jgi:hypothetical protein
MTYKSYPHFEKKIWWIRNFVVYLYSFIEIILWGRAVVARKAHNLEAVGSNPSPATKKDLVVPKNYRIFTKFKTK